MACRSHYTDIGGPRGSELRVCMSWRSLTSSVMCLLLGPCLLTCPCAGLFFCWSVLLPYSMRLGSIGDPPLLNTLPFDSYSFADMEELARPPASSAKTAHLPPLLQTLLAPLSRAPGRLIGSQFRIRL